MKTHTSIPTLTVVSFFPEKSPASKTSKTMKPIEEKIEDDVFIESEPDSPVKKRHTPTTAIEEV